MQIDLNPEQKQAVETTEGAVLVLSGAGAGKTRVLTTRLAYIIENGMAQAWECLAVTFTNKAAREMEERLLNMIGPVANSVWLGTFHRTALKILRRHADLLGFSSGFVILGENDQERLLKQIMEEEGLDVKKHSPAAVMEVIQSWKDKAMMPENVIAGEKKDFLGGKILALYRLYQTRLKNMNAMDFGDLLLLCLELLKSNQEVLEKYQKQFRYIMVDEYQDTNTVQYLWLRLLAKGHGNICCVGDDDQSIYSWRGAEIANILKFDSDFKEAKIIRLERNYRSTSHILAAASGLIRNNKGRLGKELKVADEDNPATKGEKIFIQQLWSGREEAATAAQKIEDEHRSGTPYANMAVLLRTGFQTREFEEAFITNAIPYQVIGGAKFYEREEIRDAVAYMRLLFESKDDMAFMRIINKPRRGIGDASVALLREKARNENISLLEAARKITAEDDVTLRAAAKKNIRLFLSAFDEWKALVDEKLPPAEIMEKVLIDSGYLAMWKESNVPEAETKLENLHELIAVLKESFDTVLAFLEHVSLVTDTDDLNQDDKVNLMTLHAAKGLEFDVVITGGWEEGIFPHQRALDEGGEAALEEERRLAYVGITRARRKVYIFFAANRWVYNQRQNYMPSRFIREIPAEHVQFAAAAQTENYAWGSAQKIMWQKPSFNKSALTLKAGVRVYHKNFGYGVILKTDGDRLSIAFEDIGIKNVMADYVEAV